MKTSVFVLVIPDPIQVGEHIKHQFEGNSLNQIHLHN